MINLRERLQATVDDPKIFDMRSIEDKPAATAQLKEMFGSLYVCVIVATGPGVEKRERSGATLELKYPGAAIFEAFPILENAWLKSIRAAFDAVSRQKDVKGNETRNSWPACSDISCAAGTSTSAGAANPEIGFGDAKLVFSACPSHRETPRGHPSEDDPPF